MAARAQHEFARADQSEREHWRSIVLFGRNVASYKFALAKSLLEVASQERDLVPLDELAVPFARNVCEHLARVDRQGTFAHSRFLDACRFFNAGRINADELREATTLLGFNNVIDAFHVVGSGEVPTRFFIDERAMGNAIRLTDELLEMRASVQADDLDREAEARWRLVEEAWQARAEGEQLIVLYDAPKELLVPALLGKRRPITEIRPALNGYQKGHCFYCFAPISLTAAEPRIRPEVDHFFPHVLMTRGLGVDLDMPWNLVLACQRCNGAAGKHFSLPAARYLERLHTRNEYLIASNHPLKETIILMTGRDTRARRSFLRSVLHEAEPLARPALGWQASELGPALF